MYHINLSVYHAAPACPYGLLSKRQFFGPVSSPAIKGDRCGLSCQLAYAFPLRCVTQSVIGHDYYLHLKVRDTPVAMAATPIDTTRPKRFPGGECV